MQPMMLFQGQLAAVSVAVLLAVSLVSADSPYGPGDLHIDPTTNLTLPSGILPQCVPGEPGCKDLVERVMDFLDPVAWSVNALDPIVNYRRESVMLQLYKPNRTGGLCDGSDEDNELGEEYRLIKNKCVTFKEWPLPVAGVNYELPGTKIFDFCDITFFDGKKCTGNPVYKLDGYNTDPHVVNGQRYCHRVPWAKSVVIGPCA